jgi:hypothetical protein
MYMQSLLSVVQFSPALQADKPRLSTGAREDPRRLPRPEDMRLPVAVRLLFAVVTVLALAGALVELLSGRRPILLGGGGKLIAAGAVPARA